MKRLISAILSLTMIATLFGIIPFSASAADGDVNLLTGLVPEIEYTTDGGQTMVAVKDDTTCYFRYLNDGVVDSDSAAFQLPTVKFAETIDGNKVYYKDGSKVWLDIKFDLGHLCDVNSFVLENFRNGNSNVLLCTSVFKVYLSDTEADLYSESNVVVNYGENWEYTVTKAIETTEKARYFGFRILSACYNISAVENVYPRINELQLFGTKPADSTYGTNILSGKMATAQHTTDGGKTMVNNATDFTRLTDGTLDRVCYINTPLFAETVNGSNVYYADGTKVWLDIKFDLGATADINFFRMYGNTYDGALSSPSKYNVYFSTTEDDLFTDASKVIERDTYNANTFTNYEEAFDKPISARYVGVKVLFPVRQNLSSVANVYTRIAEIQAFGEVNYGSNLISGVKATAQHTTDGGKTIVNNSYDLTRLTDGDKEKFCYINEPLFAENVDGVNTYYTDGTKVWLDIKFDLGRRSTLNKLNIFNNTNGVLAASIFKIYFSNEADSLFTPDNLEIDYNKHLVGGETNLELMLGGITGRYMGIRVLFPCTLNTSSINLVYTTFREIELLGTALDLDHTVTFKDSNGSTVYECYAEADGGISAADIAAAVANLPEVYGYKLSDEIWNSDVTAPIVADATFTALYVRDTETTYQVTAGDEQREYTFDYRVDFANKSGDVTWLVNGEFYDYGDKTSVYTFGAFEVTTSDAAAPTVPVVSVVGTAEPTGKFITFVRVYNPTDKEILGYGVRFTTGTVYGMMNGCEWDDDSIAEAIPEYTANKSRYIADYAVSASAPENYMVTLNGVTAGKLRYAKAYITFADGTVYSAVCGNAATK